MRTYAAAAFNTDADEFLGASAHLHTGEMHAYLRSAFDPEGHLTEVADDDLIEALTDELQVRVLVESRETAVFHQQPDPAPVLVTDDAELKCPVCGHVGSMVRLVSEISTEKVWLATWGRTTTDATGNTTTSQGHYLESKSLDTESGETAYRCYECDVPLDLSAVD